MVSEVVPGVFDLELGVEREQGTVVFHAAAIETTDGVVLVDTGLPSQADDVLDALDDVGYGPSDVSLVLFTHQDGDHAGAGQELRERTGAATAAHERAAPFVDGREQPIKSDGDRYPPVAVDLELVGGETIVGTEGRFAVVETPGHAPGHVSLYDADRRFLLTGDALTARDGELRGPVPEFTPDMDEAAASIRTLAGYDVESALCFHGGYAETSSEEIESIAERV